MNGHELPKAEGALETAIEEEDQWTARAMTLTFCLIAARLKSCLWHIDGYIGRVAGLLGPEKARADTLAHMKECDAAWAEA